MSHLFDFPCGYGIVAFVFVVFHIGRGVIGQTWRIPDNPLNPNNVAAATAAPARGPVAPKIMSRWEAIWMIYAHDALLHLCCTVFGFVCLLLVYRLVDAGNTSGLAGLVLLAVVGLAGVTGQLAVALSLGKFPSAG